MPDTAANPFAALSFIVAPAVLTNASSVLVLSTSNRLARAVDGARGLARQLEDTDDLATPVAARRLRELTAVEERSMLLLRALRSFYLALSAFASAALLSLLGAVLVPAAPTAVVRTVLESVAILAGIVAVGGLAYGL